MADKDKDTEARRQWERYQYMLTAGHEDYVAEANENDEFYLGTGQWDKEDVATLKAEGRPCETINQIMPKVNNIMGEQIASRNEITAKPRDSEADEQTGQILTKVLKQVQQSNRFSDLMTDIFEDGIIRARGFLDFTVEFKVPGMPGDIKIDKKHPSTILIDPHAFSYDPNDWFDFFESRWMSFNDIGAIFGRKKAENLETKQIGDANSTFGFNSIRPWGFGGADLKGQHLGDNAAIRELPIIRVNSRQFREWTSVSWFLDPRTRDTSRVPPAWTEERIEQVAQTTGLLVVKLPGQQIRHRISGDTEILFDKPSIYRSFTIVPFFPMFRWGKTMAVVTNLKGPQRVLNKMTSQELHILNVTANGGWLVEEDSLVNMDIDDLQEFGSKTGISIEYKKGATPPEKIKPNQRSDAHDRLGFRADQNIKDISTINDSRLGNDREDVAAKAITAKQQRGSVNLKRFESNEWRTLYFAGRKMVELIQGFYTEPRIIRITGSDPVTDAPTDEELPINQRDPVGEVINDLSIGEFDIFITNTPSKDNQQEAQFDEAVRMREMGVQLPDSVLIRNSTLENKVEISQAMQDDPITQKIKEAELLAKQMDIVDTFASARKKDADANATLAQQSEDPGPSKTEQFQTDRLLKLLGQAQDGEIKRIQGEADANRRRE